MAVVRIVVADDQPEFRELLCEQLIPASDVEVVEEARDGWEAIAAVARLVPDVLILALDMRELSGHEVLEVVRWYSPSTKVIIILGNDEEQTILEVLRQGAQGYIVKNQRTDLAKAIRAVHGGEVWAPRRLLARLLEEFLNLGKLMTFPTTKDEPAPT